MYIPKKNPLQFLEAGFYECLAHFTTEYFRAFCAAGLLLWFLKF
jgi:hypothetical protein